MKKKDLMLMFLAFLLVFVPTVKGFLGEVKEVKWFKPRVQAPTDEPYVLVGFGVDSSRVPYCKVTNICIKYAKIIKDKQGNCKLANFTVKCSDKRVNLDIDLENESGVIVGFGSNFKNCHFDGSVWYRKLNPDCSFSDVKYYQPGRGPEKKINFSDSAIVGIALKPTEGGGSTEGVGAKYRKLCFNWLPNAPPDRPYEKFCCYPENAGRISPSSKEPFSADYEFLCDGTQWHKAAQEPFKVYVINSTQYISNVARWYRCNAPSPEGIPNGYVLPSVPADLSAYRFLCYDNRFYECCVPGETCHLEGSYPEQVINVSEPVTIVDRNVREFAYSPSPQYSSYISDDDISSYKSIRLKINTSGKNLVFFVNFSKVDQESIRTEVILAEGTANDITNLNIFVRKPLFYFAKEIAEGKFVRVEIPVYGIPLNRVDQLIFFLDTSKISHNFTIQVKDIYVDRDDLVYCTDEFKNPPKKYDYWVKSPESEKICSHLFTWTGTKCCYDQKDYIDENGTCLNGLPILDGEAVHIEQNRVCKTPFCIGVTYATFFGQVIPQVSFKKFPLDFLLKNKTFFYCEPSRDESPVQPKKYKKVNPCTTKGSFFCSFSEGWSNAFSGTVASERNTTSSDPFGKTKNCCHPHYCWNGTECVASLHDRPKEVYNISGNNFRCVFGKWYVAPLKYDWLFNQTGYCPYPEQCLVDPNGNALFFNDPSKYSPDPGYSDNPICINHSQYIFDHLCSGGNWTTRTRMLASILLNLTTTGDYFTLLCDNYSNVLPEPDLRLDYIEGRSTFLTTPRTCFSFQTPVPCVNNFCVLRFNDGGTEKTLFAVSLNKPINDSTNSFLYALGLSTTYCDNIVDFDSCSGDNKLWYDRNLNAVFYSKQGISMKKGFFSKVFDWFASIIRFITGTWKPKTILGNLVDLSSIEKHQNYDAMYIVKRSDKQILAIKEERINETYIIARLENVSVSVCDSLKGVSQTFCNQTGNLQTILSFNPDVWKRIIQLRLK